MEKDLDSVNFQEPRSIMFAPMTIPTRVRKSRLHLILTGILCLWLFAGQVQSQLTPDGANSSVTAFRYEVSPNLTYLKTDTQDLKLDLYVPYKPKAKKPTLVWFHGGGWTRSSKDEEVLYILPYLEAGWTVVNVEYRLADKALAPAAVEDCQCALRWISANATSHNIDLERLVLSGISAGGHLALAAAIVPRPKELDARCRPGADPKVAAVINWFGASDIGHLVTGPNSFDQAVTWIGNGIERNEMAKSVSPVYFAQRGSPPVITIHGDRDRTIPYQQSVRLHAALTRAGVPNRLVTIKGGGHGDFKENQTLFAYRAIRDFLNAHRVWSNK